ncbi:hypothetical protein FHR84_000793 [Actinopolyspora biskrensis]|uniref:Uncharacterized protein n=1 Tax=Actinopolyspora biskrensis TaxID=1470178 RepID=A0A852YV81_9ACTN|nr:hypothetical protein [Actinopolyspora biskrensis]NYH77479.1 hypothetical protein [Actinopolyspora biskrensis]
MLIGRSQSSERTTQGGYLLITKLLPVEHDEFYFTELAERLAARLAV